MKPKTYAYLYELDATGWERPEGFDYGSEMLAVSRIKPEIEAIIGHPMQQDTCVQDASHFTDLVWADKSCCAPGETAYIAIRFSAFGRMVTVYSGNDGGEGLTRVEAPVVALLTAHGYRYIPKTLLDEEYPGAEDWMQGWTWFTRFFYYL